MFYEHIFPYQSDIKHETTSLPLPLVCDDPTYEDNERAPTELPQQEQPQNNVHRQSTRERRTPTWLRYYVVNFAVTRNVPATYDLQIKAPTDYTPHTFPYNISNHFEKTYVNFLTNLSTVSEPSNFEQGKKAVNGRKPWTRN